MLKNKRIYVVPILGFCLMILVTSVLLELPVSRNSNLNKIDSVFEAASVITATGSTVVNVSENFSFIGQLVMLIAMEVGAIGFMLFFSMLFLVSKKKMKLADTVLLSNEINTSNYNTLKSKALKITRYTVVTEFFGAWLLALKFIPKFGLKKGLWYSVFHSVSAFCNVGIDIFGVSFEELFKDDLYVNIVFIVIMFLGALGFFVLEDFVEWFCTGKKNKINTQSKIIFNMSIFLVFIGTVLLKIYNPELSLSNAIFLTVTSRNTGFSPVNIENLSQINQFILVILMFIGGGPGSNAGGIRIMVFFILYLTTIANVRNRSEVVAFYRSVSDKVIKRAIAILIIDLTIVFCSLLVFAIFEERTVLDMLFHIVSSFSNTGLSTIDLSTLTFAGKCVSILVMYLGRIAPITLVSVFMPVEDKKNGIKYPNMDVIL